MNGHRLNETQIGSAKVIVYILPKGKVIPDVKISPTSITIHNTGNIGAAAKNNHNYMKNLNKSGDRTASWHFTVDDKEIYQAQSCNFKCYHAGTTAGNNSSIGIEICMFEDKERQRKCYENAIALVKILLANYGWGIDKVKQHYDWSKKNCPAWLRAGKFGYDWNWFKNQIVAKTEAPVAGTPFIVRVLVDSLNVRKGPGTSNAVVTTIKKNQAFTIVEVNGNWGLLKSYQSGRNGWINISSSYVKRV